MPSLANVCSWSEAADVVPCDKFVSLGAAVIAPVLLAEQPPDRSRLLLALAGRRRLKDRLYAPGFVWPEE
jgi:hypothetical protein